MSLPDSVFTVPLAFWFISYVRNLLNTQTQLPQWDKWLKYSWIISFVVVTLIEQEWDSDGIYWTAILAVTVATAYLVRSYRPARTLMLASIPFVVLKTSLIGLERLFPAIFKTNEDYFSSGLAFSIVWLIAFSIIASRQKKALVAEQLEREREAELRRIIEAKKNELEYLVAERTAEITRQKEEIEHALVELKATQTQLIHSEKMASLGELTAGIAHEIQNPLNFVTNFSEVSIELLDELAEEQTKADRDPELEAELLSDLKQNLQKITHHGGRASSIVKGMLQHSRAGTGNREPTDLNALCDEYLRLAYHGLRAKDKTFNAKFSTDLDASLGQVSMIPQDMGRVLLNLFTNAFYAVQQRQKTAGPTGYEPTVTVSTRCAHNEAVIIVSDNGTGMPEAVQQKIFQPFFTTKPTGEGTGLGLSMAYDIVTKGHSGTLLVESVEGEGTKFVITLPA